MVVGMNHHVKENVQPGFGTSTNTWDLLDLILALLQNPWELSVKILVWQGLRRLSYDEGEEA